MFRVNFISSYPDLLLVLILTAYLPAKLLPVTAPYFFQVK